MAHTITRDDIMALDAYGKVRVESRKRISAMKENRRVSVGPYATFYFENRDTMLHQIHEMLYIEKGGEGQIADELSAYAPLVPNGHELVATLMIEIEEENLRRRELARMGHIEDDISFTVEASGERVVVNGDDADGFVRRPCARAKHLILVEDEVADAVEKGDRGQDGEDAHEDRNDGCGEG